MIAQATAVQPAETKTCSQCKFFNNYMDSRGCGWCLLFEKQAREHHQQTNDCLLNSQTSTAEAEDNLATFSNVNLDELEAFPKEVIELDREGYPMGEQTPENAYFNPNFVTYPNEPF